jgi:amino acid transporter
MPDKGGYYVWVRRATGPFWGFQGQLGALTLAVTLVVVGPVVYALLAHMRKRASQERDVH